MGFADGHLISLVGEGPGDSACRSISATAAPWPCTPPGTCGPRARPGG